MTLQQLEENKKFSIQKLEEADDVGFFIACMTYGNMWNEFDRLIKEHTNNKENNNE